MKFCQSVYLIISIPVPGRYVIIHDEFVLLVTLHAYGKQAIRFYTEN